MTTKPAAVALWQGLNQTHHQLSNRLDAALTSATGLSVSWFEVLDALVQQTGPVRVADLSDQVTLSPSRVCRVLHTMEQKGFVVRLSSPADARATDVTVTDVGRSLTDQARAVIAEVLDGSGFNSLTLAETKALAAAWPKLVQP